MSNDKQQTPGNFIKDLEKIGAKNPKEIMDIYRDLSQLEEVARGVRAKSIQTTLKIKKMKNKSFWQLTSGDYRVWYDFDENDGIRYLKIFKKEKNETPARHFNTVEKVNAEVLPSKELNVKLRLKTLEEKNVTRKKKRETKKKE